MFEKENFKIPLDKFIDNALYDSKKGYYMKKNPFGKTTRRITYKSVTNKEWNN